MLKRQALLLKAGNDALQEEDKARLEVRTLLPKLRIWALLYASCSQLQIRSAVKQDRELLTEGCC